ncbi:peptide chain release factor N(5)-glutamine methyltransferase [Chloroflexota bacterium]
MTVKQALSRAREVLASANIEAPYLEAELLMRHTLKMDRVEFYLELYRELTPGQYGEFQSYVERRLCNEPVAYIIGHREFYGLELFVNSSVLIPRPESELLVDKALELVRNRHLSIIADIGTGCGAIAVSLAYNLPQTRIYATDISSSALEVALSNCKKHGVEDRVTLLEGDLLDPLPEPVDLIIANLPYVREPELCKVNTLGFEPSLALNGGSDGLDKIHRLCVRAGEKLRTGGCLLLEIGQGQGEAVTAFLHNLYPFAGIELIPDLGGMDRVVSISLV